MRLEVGTMRRITWAAMTAMGLGLAVPAHGDDPPVTDSQGAYEEKAPAKASGTAAEQATPLVEEIRTGAASMEPSDQETGEDRVERAFVESIWNSP